MTVTIPAATPWPLLKKILFRFFFIYFTLYIAPLESIGFGWLVIKANAQFFQVFGVQQVTQVFNGSGDTSYDWATVCLILSLAVTGTLIWSVADYKRKTYNQLHYLLCFAVRYTLLFAAFSYGIIKIFVLQMPYPLYSQLATPLGNYLPMRFSWLFIGYSAPYQIFSGVMELVAALLLLYRRTVTLGVMVAAGVFINVLMLNLCYDIPVKLYAMHLTLMSLFLLVNEFDRLFRFFVLHTTAPEGSIYTYPFTKKWQRITRWVIKTGFVLLLGYTFYGTWENARQSKTVTEHKDFKSGVYDVTTYVLNKDTLPALLTDTLRWQDFIIEKNGMGSINTHDTLFRKRYGRGYFVFTADTVQPVIHFKKLAQDTADIMTMYYKRTDSNTLQLWGYKHTDSLFVELKKSSRHFQLAENQFHWLSEANR